MNTREKLLKAININLNELDQMVVDGIVTRQELTDIILRRHILAMKQVQKYMKRNIGE